MKADYPSVSVIIPAYNAEDFVQDAVYSAAAQTHPPHEIICVDDGSTDGTAARLADLAETLPGQVHVLHQPNRGPSAARNRGLAVAGGDYIQFLDADDLLEPDKLEHQVRLIEEAPHPPDVIVASYSTIQSETRARGVIHVSEDFWTGLLRAHLGITSANLWRADAVRDVGGWREDLLTSEDPDLCFRLLQAGAVFARDVTPLTTLRRRPESQWNRDKRRSLEGWIELRGRVWRHLVSNALDTPERRRAIESKAYWTLRSLMTQEGYSPRAAAAFLRRAGVPCQPHAEPYRYRMVYTALGFSAAERVRKALRALRS